MSLHEFLYSRSKPGKYYRHAAFWICSYLPFLMFDIIAVYAKPYDITFMGFLNNQLLNLPSLAVDMVFTYVVWYYFIPVYRRTLNVPLLVTGISGAVLIAFIARALWWYARYGVHIEDRERLGLNAWFMFTHFFNEGCIMRCGLFLSCVMLRNFYSKAQEKEVLMQENATAELQVLKAQVHPHFLFNTLNNIYSFSLRKSPVAESLVSKLSDTLRYMITECEAPLVVLGKEIKMLRDYIGLESVRYGTRLSVNINISGNTTQKMIAPLLLIPLVENSFKHGASQVIDKAWIDLKMGVLNNQLHFTIKNSKPYSTTTVERKNGIGLRNVKKRLMLLYPANHQMVITDNPDSYEVHLTVPILHDQNITDDKY